MNTDHLYLAHHGIKGMKWGVRRFQNEDGSLTDAGKLRYKVSADGSLVKLSRGERKLARAARDQEDVHKFVSGQSVKLGARVRARSRVADAAQRAADEYRNTPEGRAVHDSYDRAYREYTKWSNYSKSNPRVEYFATKARDEVNKQAQVLQRSEGRYVCSSLVSRYGEQGMRRFVTGTVLGDDSNPLRTGETITDRWLDQYSNDYMVGYPSDEKR